MERCSPLVPKPGGAESGGETVPVPRRHAPIPRLSALPPLPTRVPAPVQGAPRIELPLPLPAELAELRAAVQVERARFAELTRAFRTMDATFCEPVRVERALGSRPTSSGGAGQTLRARNLASWVEARRASIVTHGGRIHDLLRALALAEEAHARTYRRLYHRALQVSEMRVAERARAIGLTVYEAAVRANQEAERVRGLLASATITEDPPASVSQVLARDEGLEVAAHAIAS